MRGKTKIWQAFFLKRLSFMSSKPKGGKPPAVISPRKMFNTSNKKHTSNIWRAASRIFLTGIRSPHQIEEASSQFLLSIEMAKL